MAIGTVTYQVEIYDGAAASDSTTRFQTLPARILENSLAGESQTAITGVLDFVRIANVVGATSRINGLTGATARVAHLRLGDLDEAESIFLQVYREISALMNQEAIEEGDMGQHLHSLELIAEHLVQLYEKQNDLVSKCHTLLCCCEVEKVQVMHSQRIDARQFFVEGTIKVW